MGSRIKIFKIFLLSSIFLDGVFSILNYFLLTNYLPEWRADSGVLFLVLSLIFFMIATVFVYRLLKKYPSQHISNITEGLVFTFAIITFLLAFIDLLFIYVFTDLAFDLQKRKENQLTPTLLFVCASSLIAIICSIFVAINSLRLLKIIRRNRWDLAQQIKNIGTDKE